VLVPLSLWRRAGNRVLLFFVTLEGKGRGVGGGSRARKEIDTGRKEGTWSSESSNGFRLHRSGVLELSGSCTRDAGFLRGFKSAGIVSAGMKHADDAPMTATANSRAEQYRLISGTRVRDSLHEA